MDSHGSFWVICVCPSSLASYTPFPTLNFVGKHKNNYFNSGFAMKYKDILVNLLTATYRYVWKRETCDFYISSGNDKENLFDHLVTS